MPAVRRARTLRREAVRPLLRPNRSREAGGSVLVKTEGGRLKATRKSQETALSRRLHEGRTQSRICPFLC